MAINIRVKSIIFYKDLRLFTDNTIRKTLKASVYKSYIDIVTFRGACFFAKAYGAKVLSISGQHIFLFQIKMSVIQS